MFRVTTRGLDSAIRRVTNVSTGKLQMSLQRAVRQALQQTKRDAGEIIESRYTIAPSKVTKTIKIKASGLSGSMTSQGPRNPLKHFQIRPRSRPKVMPRGGVYVQNVRGQGGYLLHAFIWRRHVFERMTRKRLKIRKLTGPSAGGMLSKQGDLIALRLFENAEATISDAVWAFI